MIEIDGSFGEGGGQIVRTSITLSMLTEKPIVIKKIRANRKKPGLGNQHIAAIKAACQISAASVNGLELGSSTLEFNPGKSHAGNYYFDIGTAGSTTLVLQTILFPLVLCEKSSRIKIKGGTHNPFAPTSDFIKKTYLPCLEGLGIKAKLKLEKYGFYPRGGGEIDIEISPAKVGKLNQLELIEEPDWNEFTASVILANLPEHIAKRELGVLKNLFPKIAKTSIQRVERSHSPGNVVNLFAKSKQLTQTFSNLGKRGVAAEKVAEEVFHQLKRQMELKVPVGEYLADQLLIPMALSGGGKFMTVPLSKHTLTNIDTIKKFLDVNIVAVENSSAQHLIKLES